MLKNSLLILLLIVGVIASFFLGIWLNKRNLSKVNGKTGQWSYLATVKTVTGNKMTYILKLNESEGVIEDVTKIGLLTRTELSGDFLTTSNDYKLLKIGSKIKLVINEDIHKIQSIIVVQ